MWGYHAHIYDSSICKSCIANPDGIWNILQAEVDRIEQLRFQFELGWPAEKQPILLPAAERRE